MQAASEGRIADILCVGADEVELQLRGLVLERNGYRVSTARSTALALELFRIRHLDIVVSNYALNGGTSHAMLRTMRQQRPDLARGRHEKP
jgi:CheY-like chemotaxis protein